VPCTRPAAGTRSISRRSSDVRRTQERSPPSRWSSTAAT
jgi:hypothetical protein